MFVFVMRLEMLRRPNALSRKQEFIALILNYLLSHAAVNGIYNGRYGIEKNVQAVFDMGGVRGYVQFIQEKPGAPVEINVNMAGLDQYPGSYVWRIHNYPARFSLLEDYPCSESEVGEVYDPDPVDVGTAGDLYATHGGIRNDMPIQTFMNTNITLCGPDSIIGRSLRIDRGDFEWICANIEYHGARVERLRATYDFDSSRIQGDVILTKVIGRDDATVEVDLVRRGGVDVPLESTGHVWGIYHGPCSDLSDGVSYFLNSIDDCFIFSQYNCNFCMYMYTHSSNCYLVAIWK